MNMKSIICAMVAWLCCGLAGAVPVHLDGLSGPVEVRMDAYGIPHIFAAQWSDAARVLGYLHASNRLFEMELTRRRASGTLAEIMGEGAVNDDHLVRQLGIRRGCDELWNSGLLPDEMRATLEAYCGGVNAKIAEFGKDLPGAFQLLGIAPAPWTPVDCMVFGKYMAWDQSGTEDDLWFGTLLDKLGAADFGSLWPLDRPYEIPAVKMQADRAALARAELETIPGMTDLYKTAIRAAGRGFYGRGGAFGSNNWAVSGAKTQSGKPMLCSDPHLGFNLPSIWYTAHMAAEGRMIAGVTFPGSPTVVIGFNERLAWGITNMQSDVVDYFIETMNPDNPKQYKHRGEWKTVTEIVERIPVKGEATREIAFEYTVHGPIVSREGHKAVSLQWNGLGMTTDPVALYSMGRARNLGEFLAALDKLISPPLNMMYADVDGHIAAHPCGKHPIRTHGQGRVPMDGASGENDWGEYIPREKLPLAVDPVEGFVATANGRPASIGYPFYLGWQWDPSCRVRRIHEMLTAAKDLTIETMAPIQNDAHDLFAERFLPVFLQAMPPAATDDPFARKALEMMGQWNYVASPDSTATILWMRWMDAYRSAVWDDEWAARGIEKTEGSWGFSGDNKREPELEVLEFLTREDPKSIWFDDRNTSERETRDDIIRGAFGTALAAVRNAHGDDFTQWQWKNMNILKIRSMTEIPELARTGGPCPGDAFTVNPGGDGGTVGGGASWRMIVDLGDPSKSVGVFPGGQSENPSTSHYDDQMPLWCTGQYIPLHAVTKLEDYPQDAVAEKMTFAP